MTVKVVQGFVGPSRPTARDERAQSPAPATSAVSATQISPTAAPSTHVISEAVVTTIKATPRSTLQGERPPSDLEAKRLAEKVAKAISNDNGESFEDAHAVDYLAKSGNGKNYLL